MHYIRKWKRWVAVSCSHGDRIHPAARYEVLTWLHNYKPHLTMHLGDFVDTTAFLAGGNTTEDAPIAPDLEAGIEFLREFHVGDIRHTWCGNHEDRLWRYLNDRREMVRYSAQCCIEALTKAAVNIRSSLFLYDPRSMWKRVGNTLFGHGTIFNENAARDLAEQLGENVVFGHTHKVAIQPARSGRNVTGYNIGWLGDRNSMGYAKTRRATSAWQNAFAYGEYTDDETTIHVQVCRHSKQKADYPAIG